MNDKEIIERLAKLEQAIQDRNGWIRRIERRLEAIDKRVWALLVSMIVLIATLVGWMIR